MNNNRYDWVWIDLDDTLIDFRANSRLTLRRVYADCALERFFPTCEAWMQSYETHNHHLWDLYSRAEITQSFLRIDRFATPLRPTWTGSEDDLIAFARELDPLYLDILAEQRTLIPGAMELLKHLRGRRYNIGILSNGFEQVQMRKLAVTGIGEYVDLTVLSDHIGINKPDPRIYLHAMERAASPTPSRHLMIGDNLATDIAGAISAGWHAVLFDRDLRHIPSPADRHTTVNSLSTLLDTL